MNLSYFANNSFLGIGNNGSFVSLTRDDRVSLVRMIAEVEPEIVDEVMGKEV